MKAHVRSSLSGDLGYLLVRRGGLPKFLDMILEILMTKTVQLTLKSNNYTQLP